MIDLGPLQIIDHISVHFVANLTQCVGLFDDGVELEKREIRDWLMENVKSDIYSTSVHLVLRYR